MQDADVHIISVFCCICFSIIPVFLFLGIVLFIFLFVQVLHAVYMYCLPPIERQTGACVTWPLNRYQE